MVGLRQNEVKTDDSFLPLGFNGENSYTFWDIENIQLSDRPRRASDIFFEMEVYLDPQIIYHSRTVYSFFDVLGDVGGVLQILSTVIAFILSSYSEKAFIFDFMDQMKILAEKPRFSHMLCRSSLMQNAYDDF